MLDPRDTSNVTEDEVATIKQSNNQSITTALDAYNCCTNGNGKTDLNIDYKICSNIGGELYTSTSPTELAVVSEVGCAITEGSPWFAPDDCTPMAVADWKQDVDDLVTLMANDITTLIMDKGDCNSWPGNSYWLFFLGSIMLGLAGDDGPPTYVRAENDSYTYAGNTDAYEGHWQALTYQWGNPTAAYALDNNDLYYREFANGWVFVNPSNTARTSTVLGSGNCYQKFLDSSGGAQNWQGLSDKQCGNLEVGAYSAEFLWSEKSNIRSVNIQ
jgi:hypothetical protein